MELLLRRAGESEWERAGGVLRGLARAVDSRIDTMLYCGDPAAEQDDLIAAVRFYVAAAGRLDVLAIGSPCPSPDWIAPVRAMGAGRILVVRRLLSWPRRVAVHVVLDVPEDICPSLHVVSNPGMGLSVCGRRADMAVLVEHHFSTRCFLAWRDCPFRAVESVRAEGRSACT